MPTNIDTLGIDGNEHVRYFRMRTNIDTLGVYWNEYLRIFAFLKVPAYSKIKIKSPENICVVRTILKKVRTRSELFLRNRYHFFRIVSCSLEP